MPNIEIHGLGRDPGGSNEARRVTEEIFRVIKDHAPDLSNEAVVTAYFDACVDINISLRPFLRICSSKHEHFEVLVGVLMPLGMDIETLKLEKFYPKL